MFSKTVIATEYTESAPFSHSGRCRAPIRNPGKMQAIRAWISMVSGFRLALAFARLAGMTRGKNHSPGMVRERPAWLDDNEDARWDTRSIIPLCVLCGSAISAFRNGKSEMSFLPWIPCFPWLSLRVLWLYSRRARPGIRDHRSVKINRSAARGRLPVPPANAARPVRW